MRYLKLIQFIVLVIISLNGCSKQSSEVGTQEGSPLSSKHMFLVSDDIEDVFQGDLLDRGGLIQATKSSIVYFDRVGSKKKFFYGKVPYSAKEMTASMKLFLELLQSNKDRDEFIESLQDNFLVFASPSNEDNGVMFTGYYEPIFPGQLTKNKEYNIPVYRRPDDLQVLNLGSFRKNLKRRTIVYRMVEGTPEPYYTRQQIMGDKALAGKNLAIAWMKDPADLFFLQVQGSGILAAPDGTKLKIGYDGSNGRPYSSIGKYLIDQGAMRLSEISMGSIRGYLKNNPKQRDRVLFHNQSYVFFKLNGQELEGPKGNINVPLTPLRSVAADATAFPKGSLAYIRTEVPEFDEDWKHTGNKPVSHFVLIQDTGGAIKGTGRMDLFWGNGALAENSAGAMRSKGQLYFFVAKKEVLKQKM